MRVRGSLSPARITDLLEDATIPIRLACRTPEDNLWMCSLWYRLERTEADEPANGETDGGWRLRCATAASADIVSFLEADPRVAFEVSTNQPPYAGVRGRGAVSIDPDPEKETLRDLLERYLGDTESQLAGALLDEDREEVTTTIEPAVVYGWDFAERMADVEATDSS
ncbi:pyridoxamine 5'-phosphate oxidase family protein [Haloterrigena sp. SYSU A558-1]|uniref:Pyridoxamine 5'-phosphate oxidase family protein n=1 Tax=Haloterrigena gelatinilytica TaxID=2741724 RepID=A0ABX2L967_9EURY|nr:pyridoxamine 5'-phosphate oxidase family protein [Haloterrigena gelatinilytica]NUC72804.1 pyridoxamine 5'-phosphate oxidase family protein [Haloterrigena gelatinilytica]